MSPWNSDFADAMRKANQQHGDSLEVPTIFAEALLNRTPWKMWDLQSGEPAEGASTKEAQAVLEAAMANDPNAMGHPPGILHLHVHLMEMSPHPELALKAGRSCRLPDIWCTCPPISMCCAGTIKTSFIGTRRRCTPT